MPIIRVLALVLLLRLMPWLMLLQQLLQCKCGGALPPVKFGHILSLTSPHTNDWVVSKNNMRQDAIRCLDSSKTSKFGGFPNPGGRLSGENFHCSSPTWQWRTRTILYNHQPQPQVLLQLTWCLAARYWVILLRVLRSRTGLQACPSPQTEPSGNRMAAVRSSWQSCGHNLTRVKARAIATSVACR